MLIKRTPIGGFQARVYRKQIDWDAVGGLILVIALVLFAIKAVTG